MTDTNSHNNLPGMNPPEGYQMGMPGEEGFYIPESSEQSSVPPVAQRIYDVNADYEDTIQTAYGEDISGLDAEGDAWRAVADIAYEVEKDPSVALTETQSTLLAAVEAHAATLKATGVFTPEQNRVANGLSKESASAIIANMARERRDRWNATSDNQEKMKLEREMTDLREYVGMLDNDEAIFDVADIDSAVNSYKADGLNPELKARARNDTRANAYFAKYAAEVIDTAVKVH